MSQQNDPADFDHPIPEHAGGAPVTPPPYDRRALISSPSSQVWLISFTDVIALMLTFFVMIFSMINPERSIMARISFSLHENQSFGGTEAGGESHAAPVQRLAAEAGKDLSYLSAVLTRNVEEYPALSGIEVTLEGAYLKIALPQDLLFESGDFTVRGSVVPALDDVFGLLGSLQNRIEIYGYSDPVPVSRPTDNYQTNWGLSQQRAASVAALVYQNGYRQAIGLYGMGVDRRVTTEMSAERLARARRVEILIHENR